MPEFDKIIELRLGETTWFPLLSRGNTTIFGYPVKIERMGILSPDVVQFRVMERSGSKYRTTGWFTRRQYLHHTPRDWSNAVFQLISDELDNVEKYAWVHPDYVIWHPEDFVSIKEPETKEEAMTEPREFPTARWESALNNAAVTFFTVTPPFTGLRPVVKYCKNATGRGVSITRGRTSKVALATFIVDAQKSGNDIFVCWPGSTQDIFKMSPEDIEIVLEKLGFMPQDKLTVEIGGRKFVYTED